jgi:hypothetical protein
MCREKITKVQVYKEYGTKKTATSVTNEIKKEEPVQLVGPQEVKKMKRPENLTKRRVVFMEENVVL